jgi:hypothetical protein
MNVSLNRIEGNKNRALNTDQGRDLTACRLVDYDLLRGLAWVHTDGRPEPYTVLLYPERQPEDSPCTCPGQRRWGRCYHVDHAFGLVFQAVGDGLSPLRSSESVYDDFMGNLTDGERESDLRQSWDVDGAVFQVLWGPEGVHYV